MSIWAEGYQDGTIHSSNGNLRGKYQEILSHLIIRDFTFIVGTAALNTPSMPMFYHSGFDSLFPNGSYGLGDKDDEYWRGYLQAISDTRYMTKKERKEIEADILKEVKQFSLKDLSKKIDEFETEMKNSINWLAKGFEVYYPRGNGGQPELVVEGKKKLEDLKTIKTIITRYKYGKLG